MTTTVSQEEVNLPIPPKPEQQRVKTKPHVTVHDWVSVDID